MKKKDWKSLTTAQLMEEIDKESNDDAWGDIFDALISRTPFEGLYEKMGELEDRLDALVKENKALKALVQTHAHLNNKVMIEA